MAMMPFVTAIETALLLISNLPALITAFNQPGIYPIGRRQCRRIRSRDRQTPKRPSCTQHALAKRQATPTKKSRQKKKKQSLESLLELENNLRGRGFRYVIGSDDSGGAGCIAGPVVVASCCVLKPLSAFLPITTPQTWPTSSRPSPECQLPPSEMDALSKVNDCKALLPEQRREIHDIIRSHPNMFAVSTAQRSPQRIDEINLTRATQEAFAESIETLVGHHNLPFEEVYAIVDGKVSPKLYASRREQSNDPRDNQSPIFFPVRPCVNGDARVYTVALSSIVASVERDAVMQQIHERFPLYGFENHSGYGRRDHVDILHRLGSIEGVHRMTFKQVKGR